MSARLPADLLEEIAARYLAGVHRALELYGEHPAELVVVDDDPPWLRVLEAVMRRPRELVGARSVYQHVVEAVAEGATPNVRALVLETMRPALVRAFAFAVPNEEMLAAIARRGPIVEVGAGGGYWARCLHARGARIEAYDALDVAEAGLGVRHHPVRRAHAAEAVRAHPEAATLLLCWPTGVQSDGTSSHLAEEAIAAFAGNTLAFVGERSPSFGSPAFFARLDREWGLEAVITLPTLPPWNDAGFVYRRA